LLEFDISNRITRGSSPQVELRQGFTDWMKKLRTIEEPRIDTSSPVSIEVSKIQESPAIAGPPSPHAETGDESHPQDDGGESS